MGRQGYITGNVITPTDYICRRVLIPNDLALIMAVNGALTSLTFEYNWEQISTTLETPAQAAALMSQMYDDYLESSVCMIGMIIPYATSSAPNGTLPCDGSTFERADYPQLYAALDAVFIIDPDHFTTPDLRGRAVIGAGQGSGLTDRPVGSQGGEESHVLTVGELAAHSHTNTPHAHSEIAAVTTLINGGLEAPASAAVPTPATTGAASVAIDNTGSDEAHNTMQPFYALNYCMVAR
jgi:microcystin-dependent protein